MQFGAKLLPVTRVRGEGVSAAVRPSGARCPVQLLVSITKALSMRLKPKRFDVQYGEASDTGKLLITLADGGAFGVSANRDGPTMLYVPLPPCVHEITFDPTDEQHYRIPATPCRWELLSEAANEKQLVIELPLAKWRKEVAAVKAAE